MNIHIKSKIRLQPTLGFSLKSGRFQSCKIVCSNARKLAVTQLVQIEHRVYSSLVDDRVIEWNSEQIARDRRLSTLLVSGVERMRLKLDYILEQRLTKPLKKLHPNVLQSLRMAVFELVELQKPSYVVNEYVNLSKEFKMSKLVNAVLRGIVRDLDRNSSLLPEINPNKGENQFISDLSIVYSHPEWMIKRWLKQFGLDTTIELLKHNNRTPVQGLRLNRGINAAELFSSLKEQGVEAEVSLYLPEHFLRVKSGLQSVLHSSQLTHGNYSIQDEAAGLVVTLMLQPKPGDRILDCCCAPGGKLTFAAQLLEDKGHITALDSNTIRLEKTIKMTKLLSVDHLISFHCKSLQEYAEEWSYQKKSFFDKVLLDVPCSGTGVMAKKSDLRWKRKQTDITELVCLQDALLEAARKLVKPGGVLVYSTCSLESEENENRIQNFLQSHQDFKVDDIHVNSDSGLLNKDGFFRTLPFVHNTDGAFAARLCKEP